MTEFYELLSPLAKFLIGRIITVPGIITTVICTVLVAFLLIKIKHLFSPSRQPTDIIGALETIVTGLLVVLTAHNYFEETLGGHAVMHTKELIIYLIIVLFGSVTLYLICVALLNEKRTNK